MKTWFVKPQTVLVGKGKQVKDDKFEIFVIIMDKTFVLYLKTGLHSALLVTRETLSLLQCYEE